MVVACAHGPPEHPGGRRSRPKPSVVFSAGRSCCMSEDFKLVVAGTADAAAVARRAIAAGYPTLTASARDDLHLLITELVSNAVRHGGIGPDRPGIELELERYD